MPLLYQNTPGVTLQALGYTIPLGALAINPADATTYFFSGMFKAPNIVADQNKAFTRIAANIKIVQIFTYATTAGTNENLSMYVRKNNTTDTLIATVGAATNERIFYNAGLNISMGITDYFEIKIICPTWVTNPLNMSFGGYIYLE